MATVRKSNLDLTGAKLVKRGALVSWHGFRGRVSRVRMGYLYPESNSPLATNVGAWVACNSVQVVESAERVADRGALAHQGPAQRVAPPMVITGITVFEVPTV